MSDEKVFVDGMIVKRHPNAPDFVKASLSLKMEDVIAFARKHHKDGWLNVQIKESRGGKLYAELDKWEPTRSEPAGQVTQSQSTGRGNPGDLGSGAPQQASAPDFSDDEKWGDIPFSNYEYKTLA